MPLRRSIFSALVASALLGCTLTGAAAEEVAAGSATVKLIAINDFHGNLSPTGTVSVPDPANPAATIKEPVGGAAYLATLVKQLQAENPLHVTVGAGDLIGASPLNSALFYDEPTIQALSAMRIEYSSVGNHEFDKGKNELQRLQGGGCAPQGTPGEDTCIIAGDFNGGRFEYLAANVIDNETHRPLFPAAAVKNIDVGRGRTVKIGFIGLVLQETPTIVTPSGVAGLSFIDEAAAANALVPKLKRQGVNAIVVLIHKGISTTVPFNDPSCGGASGDLLPILDKLDRSIALVVSGHTHQAYLCKGQGTSNDQVTYTSAGSYGRYVSDIDLTIDIGSGAITGIAAQNHLVVNDTAANPAPEAYPTLAPDRAVAKLVDVYTSAAAPLTNQVIGSITADITRSADITAGSSGESALGDVIADSQLAATQGETQQAVVAFMNPGGIRTDLIYSQISGGESPGQVTYGELFSVQPFGNSLVTMTLTGGQLYELLGQQWVGQTSPRILQVSEGFTYSWDNSLPQGQSKVVDGSIAIGGVPVDKSASYRITVNNFLASGGDNFSVLTQGTDLVGGAQDIDAMTAYFQATSPVPPGPKNRIQRVN